MKNKTRYLLVFVIIAISTAGMLYFNFENFLGKGETEKSVNYILSNKLNNQQGLIIKFENFLDKGETEKKVSFKSEIIQSVIDTAKSYMRTPNKIGGIDYDSMDASGLVQVSLKKNGMLEFPRTAQDMARYGEIITKIEDLKKGDLIFFIDTYPTERLITSVGIYIGDNEFITSTTTKGVSINKLDNPSFKDNYWKEHFFYGTRIFN